MPPTKIVKLDLKQQTLGKLWTNTDKTLKSDANAMISNDDWTHNKVYLNVFNDLNF